jgi:carboxypeptidase family protein
MGGLRTGGAAARSSAVLLIVSVFLAGCSSDAKQPTAVNAPAAPAEFDDTTGGVEGIVTDRESVPIAGAQVGILALGLATMTDGAGGFSMSKVPPGTHSLDVTAIGFDAQRETLEIRAGEVSRPEVRLARIATEESYSLHETRDGYIACGTGTYVLTQVACGAADSNQRFLFKYNITQNMTAILWEMTWQSTQALSKDLVLNLERDGCGISCNRSNTFGSAQGCCYLRILRNGTEMDTPTVKAHTDGATIQSRTFPAFSTKDHLPTVYTSQKFTIYIEYFFGPVPPDLQTRTNVPS